MKKINLVPNMITAFALSCGLFVIFKANMVEPGVGSYQVMQASVVLLLLAAFADLMDGAVARAMNAQSEFGFVFDTLSDAVSFGVAPSVLILKNLGLEQGTGLAVFAVIGAMLYSLCGVLRLVRFNVKTVEAKGNTALMADQKKHFTGLPIPAGALAAVSIDLLLNSPLALQCCPQIVVIKPILLPSLMIILGFFMVSNWKFPSLKMLHFRVPSFYLVFLTAILALFVLYGIFYFFPLILAMISWGYVILGWVLSTIRLIAGKKSKTLEDFEPDEEEEE